MPEPDETTDGQNSDKIEVSRTEFEKMKARSAAMDALEEDAISLGFNDYNEYRTYLEEKKLAELENDNTGTGNTTTSSEPDEGKGNTTQNAGATTNAAPTTAGLSKEELEVINRANRMASNTYLKADWLEFQMEQRELPEDQRSPSTKDELTTLIQGPKGQMIATLAQDKEFGGNLFAAANFVKNLPKNSKAAEEAANERATAMNNAAQTANINTTTSAPLKPGKGDPAKELADLIAPDTVEAS